MMMMICMHVHQAMLLAHDVIAHEVYSEQSLATRASPSPVAGQFTNGGTSGVSGVGSDAGGDLAEPSEPDTEMDNVTRVRLVQFQKNSNEPMVRVLSFFYIHQRHSVIK